MTLIWLAEIKAGVPGSPTESVLRVASAPTGYNHSTAPGYYPPHLIDAANIRRSIVAPRRTFGASDVGKGEIRVMNITGEYDDWFDYGYGFSCRLLLGDHLDDYDDFVVVETGKVEQPSGNKDEIIFRYRDRQFELERPASPASYAGTNSGVSGTEGLAADIKGQPKIRIFGEPLNVQPDPINANDRLFGLNHSKAGVLTSVSSIALRVQGSAWTPGSDYASIALLQAASPTQGVYDTGLAVGSARLGGAITGENGSITADVVESGTATQNQLPSIIERLLLDAGVAAGDINVELDTTSPSQAPWFAGLVVKEQSYLEALDQLCGGAAIWFCPNRVGVYQVKKFTAPGTPVAGFKRFDYPNVATATDFALIDLERLVPSDDGRGVPAWRITVNYAKSWTKQDQDGLALGLSEEQKAYHSREHLSLVWENTAIRDQFPEAVELVFDTALTRPDDAAELLAHLATLYGVPQQMYRLRARYNVAIASAIDLGDTVTVTYNRYGLDNGEGMVITGVRYDAKAFEIELELWRILT